MALSPASSRSWPLPLTLLQPHYLSLFLQCPRLLPDPEHTAFSAGGILSPNFPVVGSTGSSPSAMCWVFILLTLFLALACSEVINVLPLYCLLATRKKWHEDKDLHLVCCFVTCLLSTWPWEMLTNIYAYANKWILMCHRSPPVRSNQRVYLVRVPSEKRVSHGHNSGVAAKLAPVRAPGRPYQQR